MNDNQLKKSEYIATKIMRTLAVIGLIAVLALATWVIVLGFKLLSNTGNTSSSALSGLSSIFSSSKTEESILFDFDTRTFPVGEISTISWVHTNKKDNSTYIFSYACKHNAHLSIKEQAGWNDLTCETPYITNASQIEVVPTNTTTKFADIEIRITSEDFQDTSLVTILNETVSENPTSIITPATTTTPTISPVVVIKPPVTPNTSVQTKPTYTPTVVTRKVPLYNGPADLTVAIQETGIITKVGSMTTFFPISPIPTNKTVAVIFTVLNKGGVTSGEWRFKAELPIEGDANYTYTSPVQAPLLSGMEVEYTLTFKELLEASKGTIRIKILPVTSGDSTSNNEDTVSIKIDER